MQLWSRPHFWSRALDHFDGFPALPSPLRTTSVFDNQFDQLFDEFVDDSWTDHPSDWVRELEGNYNDKCLCSGNGERQPIHTNDNGYTVDDNDDDGNQINEYHRQDSFPRYKDSNVKFQQSEMNTERNDENVRYRDRNMGNNQHRVPRNAHHERLGNKYDSLGRHPSNQQPVTDRNIVRDRNQRILRREAGVEENDDVHGGINRNSHHDLYKNKEQGSRNFNQGRQGTMPSNRDSHTGRIQQNNVRTKPVEVYSLQVAGYQPSELQVKTEGRKVRVIGRQACSCREACAIREFERVSTLPDGVDTRNLQATLNKEGTLSIQVRNNHRLARGHYEDIDVLVEGVDLPQIEDSSKNTENCVKKAGIKLAKIDKRTGKRVPITRKYEEVPQQTFENEYDSDGVTIEVVDE